MFGPQDLTVIIGERINPTGRPKLAEELREGKFDLALDDAAAQAEAGADYIDVNTGAPGVDEAALLPRLVEAVAERTGLPVCVDSADPSALAAALEAYAVPEALVNSVTADDESMNAVLPLVAEAGCYVIAMTKDREGIPPTPEGRLEKAGKIVERAASLGIPAERVLVDCLTIPAATDGEAAAVTLASISLIRAELGCPVVLGASNISFGMPERPAINAAFLCLAIKAGLNAAIVNPLEPGLVLALRAADFLLGKDRMGRAYLKYYRAHR
ncbi:MAG: dihydropteroate synthase [Actinobacteria bacterium]|nr:dihydropteroate synthase [Actinomycetota bacterium]MDI6830136.1 dihydropteroate synthase [Actinomycetota bacterium]